MMRIDLHTHSTASDGVLTPTELVKQAAALGVRVLALTDHDTTNGVAEAQRAAHRLGVDFIPGIEINTDYQDSSLDMLGYWVPIDPGDFQAKLTELRDARETRGQRMVEKLNSIGLAVRWERVRELAQGAVGRPHVARAMVEAGYVSSIGEAFDRYLGYGRPAYAPRTRFTAFEAVEFIREHGGVPVMAHPLPPAAQHQDPFRLDELLPRLKEAGLVGLDVYYGAYAFDTVRRLLVLAKKYDLIPTGGSDYHSPESAATLGSTGVPHESVERLRRARPTNKP